MIVLRDMREGDIEDYVRWFAKDTEWMRWDAPWEGEIPSEADARREWRAYYEAVRNRPADAFRWKYEIEADGLHVGWVSAYQDMEYFDNRDGHYAVGIDIPERSARRRGVGTQALAQFIETFRARGETVVYTQTWSGNAAMIALARRLGFREAARTSGVREVEDRRYDALTFEKVLAANFEKL